MNCCGIKSSLCGQLLNNEVLMKCLSEYPVVQIINCTYHPMKNTELATDASEKLIGDVLCQEGHPVMYISRRLTSSEQSSNFESEALVIVWATVRARHFLLGKSSYLKWTTDHWNVFFVRIGNFQKSFLQGL